MTCKQARRLIALYRSGERTEAESRALQEHLRSCPACAREEKEMEISLSSARAISSQEPVLRDPDKFSGEIMSHISRLPSKRKYSVIDTLFLPARRSEVRIVLSAVVLVAIGVFGTQSIQTLMDMQRIEQQFSVSAKETERVHVNYDIDLSKVPMTREQENTLRRAGLFVEHDSHLIITARMLQIVWSIIERPIFAGTTKDVLRMGMDWNSLSQRFKASSNAKLALSASE